MTRLRPTRPARIATSSITSKIRFGLADFLSRAGNSTSTVCTKLGYSEGRHPDAYFHRASNVKRSTASRSLSPSIRCSTITVATI